MFKTAVQFLWIFILPLILFFSSCFEIVEEVNLNDDGSGNFCFTINLSQSKLQINSMLLLDSVNGRPVPNIDDLKRTISRVGQELKNDTALSLIEIKENWDDYIFSVSGHFKDVETLNNAIKNINTIFKHPRGYNVEDFDNFKFNNSVFERLYSYNLINDYNALSEKDKTVFKNARYTTIYRFAHPVKAFSNPNALKSKSGKAVMLKVNVKELITNKKTIQNSIELY